MILGIGQVMYTARYMDPAGSVRTGQYADGTVTSDDVTYDLDEITLLPPVSPTKIVCVGLNYAKHAEETNSEIPDRPLLFLKPPNAVAAPDSNVRLPSGKERIDYEAELAIVIGRQCRDVSASDADEVIEGYTVMNDISNRDDQSIEQNWVRGKAFDNSAPLGPVVATPDEVPDDASIRLQLNGDLRQDSSRSDFIFNIPELVEEITSYMTLEPGDVISTGTPAGVGPLADGDEVSITIEGIPPLTHTVAVSD
jgi:2-keto-4-pentenoate hydratase/2-oxohepta-3-ene-1,7-dioic acid hydratase (catechol pathway)